ncbi:MAG: T9SS type A sorting domain-containing protein [Bacteroidales bacterium]|nr:T9SS type A sorting domain-containing protein [Bacteroidales bacterium]
MIKRNILLLLALLGVFAASLRAQSIPCVTPSTVVYDTLCGDGLDYRFFGMTGGVANRITTAGTYRDTIVTDAGCDSIVTLHLYVVTSNAVYDTACDSYIFDSRTYTESEVVFGAPYIAFNGDYVCVLSDTLYLTINKSVHTYTDTTVCDSLQFWGLPFNVSGIYTRDSVLMDNGCYRYDTLELTIVTGSFGSFVQTACDSFMWHGTRYIRTGHYNYRYTNIKGCPSCDTLHLTISSGSFNNVVTSACDSYTWPTNGVTYTATDSVVYRYYSSDAFCYSADTLRVTIYKSAHDTIIDTACDIYAFNVNSYNRSMDTTMKVGNTAVGSCDSIVTLKVTVFHSYKRSIDSVVCDSLLWSGSWRDTSGSYITFIAGPIDNCDTSVTLNLTVNNSHTHAFYMVTYQMPYVYGDSTWSESGSYVYHGSTYQGCDSVVTINLEIIDTAHVWTPDSSLRHWSPDIHIYSYGNRAILLSHYNADSNYMSFYECRWYRDGVYLKAPSRDYYVESTGTLLPGSYWVEVALNIQRTDWALSDTITIAPSDKQFAAKPSVKVSPNPVMNGNTFNVSVGNVDNEATLSLYDMQGRLCWSGTSQEANVTVDAKLNTGVYVLQLSAPGFEPVMRKVVVR